MLTVVLVIVNCCYLQLLLLHHFYFFCRYCCCGYRCHCRYRYYCCHLFVKIILATFLVWLLLLSKLLVFLCFSCCYCLVCRNYCRFIIAINFFFYTDRQFLVYPSPLIKIPSRLITIHPILWSTGSKSRTTFRTREN